MTGTMLDFILLLKSLFCVFIYSLFIDENKLDVAAKKHLGINGGPGTLGGGGGVTLVLREYNEIQAAVKDLAESDRKIWVNYYENTVFVVFLSLFLYILVNVDLINLIITQLSSTKQQSVCYHCCTEFFKFYWFSVNGK